MTIDLTDADHRRLTALIEAILDAVTARQITRGEAMAAFAHVITAAAIGNEGELRGWLRPDTVARYLQRCDGALCPCCRRKPCVLVEHFGVAL
jgi:hypothetical protein